MAHSIEELYKKYCYELKPLIAEYEARNENSLPTMLETLGAFFDRIVLCETAPNKTEWKIHLQEAETHLDNIISETRKCVVASLMSYINDFKRNIPDKIKLCLMDGKFIGLFNRLDTEVRNAKENDIVLAYEKLKEMECLVLQCQTSIKTLSLREDGKNTNIIKWVCSIIISLIVTYMFTYIC